MKLPLISYPLTTLRDAHIAAKCRSWVSKCCHRDCVNLVKGKGNGHEIHEQLLVLPLFRWLLVNCSGMMDLCKPVPLWSENPISLNIFSNTRLNKIRSTVPWFQLLLIILDHASKILILKRVAWYFASAILPMQHLSNLPLAACPDKIGKIHGVSSGKGRKVLDL